MNKLEMLKHRLGDRYIFEKHLTEKEVITLLNQNPAQISEKLICSLTAGCVKIESVIYKSDNRLTLGYDVFVKDSPESVEWICYDNPTAPVCTKDDNMEQEMFSVLDHIVGKCGLSYNECNFKILEQKPLAIKY